MSEPAPVYAIPCLTPQQSRILGHIAGYLDVHGYGPSIREIAQLAGLAAQSVALYHVKALERAGMLTREPHIARSIRLTTRNT
jgi:repressor LexA